VNDALRWGGLFVIAMVAVARCAIVFAPQVVFDVDPAVAAGRLAGLGPGGSLALDGLLLLGCAAALWGEARSGRGVRWPLLALALIPAPILLWHGYRDLGDLWLGSTWIAAMVTAVTVAHLGRDRSFRIALLALLLAVIAPVLVRSAGQVTYEHAEKLADFDRNQARFFAAQGIDPESPSAQIFQRRLEHRNPQGWFATTNVLASMLALSLIALIGVTIAAAQANLERGWAAATGLLAIAAAAALWMCQSMGALLATAGGLSVLLVPMTVPVLLRLFERWGGAIVIVAIVAALTGVLVRGTLLHEDFAGDRSLLFRWHYMVATVRMVAEAPLTGVGSDGYQQAYTRFRVPRNPEEVTSAHSMFQDWIAGAGLWGAAWIALVGILAWRAGCRFGAPGHMPDQVADKAVGRAILSAAVGVAAIGLLGAMTVEVMVTADPLTVLLRVLGAGLYVAVAMLLAKIMAASPSRWLEWSLVGAASTLLIHGQVEMTFAQPGAAVWAMAVLGAIAAPGHGRSGGRARAGGGAAAAAIVLLSAWIAVTGAMPALRQQARLSAAAAALADLPADTAVVTAQRERAVALLVEANVLMPTNPFPLEHASRQAMLAAMLRTGPARVEGLHAALALTERSSHTNRGLMISTRTSILARLARETGDSQWGALAISEMSRLVAIDPHGNETWRRYGNLLWEFGDRDEARAAYKRALESDGQLELDPLKQFPPVERREIEARLRQ